MWGLSSNGILESYQYRVFGPFLLARKKLKSSRIPGRSTPRNIASLSSVDPTTSLGEGRSYPSFGTVVHADHCRLYLPASAIQA